MLLQPRQSYIQAAKEYEVEGPDVWDADEAEGKEGQPPNDKKRSRSLWRKGLKGITSMRVVRWVIF